MFNKGTNSVYFDSMPQSLSGGSQHWTSLAVFQTESSVPSPANLRYVHKLRTSTHLSIMAATWTLEDDMSCPVCCDVFTDPVVLGCSHSFCRSCLDNYWNTQVIKKCPVCGLHSLTDAPPSNLALRNIVETFARERSHNTTKQEETRKGEKESQGRRESGGRSGLVRDGDERCSLHGKRLLLFCVEDQEALCAVCQTSRRHRSHQLCPVDEAAQELKVWLVLSVISGPAAACHFVRLVWLCYSNSSVYCFTVVLQLP